MWLLVTLAVSSLALIAADTAFCYTRVFADVAESRILDAAPVIIRPRTPLNYSALSSYGVFAPFALWRLSVSLQPLDHYSEQQFFTIF